MRNLDLAMDRGEAPQKPVPSSKRYLIISVSIAFIIFCLVGLSFYLLFKSEKTIRKNFNSLDSRLLKMETRLNIIESADKSSSIIDEQRTRLELSLMDRMDSLEALIDMRNRKNEGDTLQREAVTEPVEIKKVKKRPVEDTRKYHIVTPGETLYRISVTYNISVDELRGLNNIGPQAVIHVGQKLQVSK
jgi:LysM repeat protein